MELLSYSQKYICFIFGFQSYVFLGYAEYNSIYITDIVSNINKMKFIPIPTHLGYFLKEINKGNSKIQSFYFLMFDNIEKKPNKLQQIKSILLSSIYLINRLYLTPIEDVRQLFHIEFVDQRLRMEVTAQVRWTCILHYLLYYSLWFCYVVEVVGMYLVIFHRNKYLFISL